MTKNRKEILNILKEGELFSAATIHEKLPGIDLVTIYRNLDLFVKAGIVKKFSYKDEAVYEYQKKPHHHAICANCKKVIHFDVDEKKLTNLVALQKFDVTDIDITVTGSCCK